MKMRKMCPDGSTSNQCEFYNIIARLQLGQEIAISHEEHLKNLYIISCRTRPGGAGRPGMTSVFLTTISSTNEDKTSNIFPPTSEYIRSIL